MNSFEMTVMVPLFVIIFLVIYNAVTAAFDFGSKGSSTMSFCIALLAIIGMNRYMHGELKVIILPYVILGLAILLMLIMFFLINHLVGLKSRFLKQIKRAKLSKTDSKQIEK
jgi:CDP-diglyceride synthetase